MQKLLTTYKSIQLPLWRKKKVGKRDARESDAEMALRETQESYARWKRMQTKKKLLAIT